MNYIRTKLSFVLLRSTLVAAWGFQGNRVMLTSKISWTVTSV